MLVLGIETTCDETAAAVVKRDDDGRATILSNTVLSQTTEHAAFGGVVPEIAARAHVEALDLIIATAMADAGTEFGDLDGDGGGVDAMGGSERVPHRMGLPQRELAAPRPDAQKRRGVRGLRHGAP